MIIWFNLRFLLCNFILTLFLSASTMQPRREPFSPGQVFNNSKALQVHVLPSVPPGDTPWSEPPPETSSSLSETEQGYDSYSDDSNSNDCEYDEEEKGLEHLDVNLEQEPQNRSTMISSFFNRFKSFKSFKWCRFSCVTWSSLCALYLQRLWQPFTLSFIIMWSINN